jgi:hypothetical protein
MTRSHQYQAREATQGRGLVGPAAANNVETITDSVSPTLSQSFQYNLGGHVTRGTGVYGP